MKRRRYVLLDRDGTIIVEKHYLSDPADVELLDGAAAGLRMLQSAGFGLVVISNQSGIGRGLLGIDELHAVEDRLRILLESEGVPMDAFYYCPHAPDEGCTCRKPATGLVTKAAKEFGFDASAAWIIGDKPSDIDLARRCGARAILVRTGYGAQHEAEGLHADAVFDNLLQAAAFITAESREIAETDAAGRF